MLQPVLDLGLVAQSSGRVITREIRCVNLLHIMVGKVMGVLITLPMAQNLGAGIMSVFQMGWHFFGGLVFHILRGFFQTHIRSVALGGASQVNSGLRERN